VAFTPNTIDTCTDASSIWTYYVDESIDPDGGGPIESLELAFQDSN